MPSIFTRIASGELPGRIVWQDDRAYALLSKNPIKPGHTLVVPRLEIDHWLDLPPELNQHLFASAQHVAQGIQQAFSPAKVGVAIVGLEVRHVHVHLVPINAPGELDFAKQDMNAKDADLDVAAEKIRAALREIDRGA